MVKFYMVGGSADGEIIEAGIEGQEIKINKNGKDEIYAKYIHIYEGKGYCAFGILINHAFDTIELEILADKNNLPFYTTEQVTL